MVYQILTHLRDVTYTFLDSYVRYMEQKKGSFNPYRTNVENG